MNKNDFAPIPPMGWNSYDYYDTSVTEEQVKANADYMAANLRQYGWEYIVVDIEWYANDAGSMRDKFQYIPFGSLEIDEYSRLMPSPSRFPSSKGGKGFEELAEYVHNLGLKFGIHIMRGIPRKAAHAHSKIYGTAATADMIADPSSVCVWNPDMYGVRDNADGQAYYDSVIGMYAKWGVDYIKCDDICDSRLYPGDSFSGWHELMMIHRAIMKTKRPIVLSLSPGPAHIDKAWMYCNTANMWRITDDFWDNWDLLKNMFERCELWQDHVKRGCYPDCDMLPLGKIGQGFGNGERNTCFTKDEQMTMMTLWCMFKSPLMIGAELTKMDDFTLSLLTNEELLSLMGWEYSARQLYRDNSIAVWVSVSAEKGRIYAALFNLSDETLEFDLPLNDLRSEAAAFNGLGGYKTGDNERVYELWERKETALGKYNGSIFVSIPRHGVKLYRID